MATGTIKASPSRDMFNAANAKLFPDNYHLVEYTASVTSAIGTTVAVGAGAIPAPYSYVIDNAGQVIPMNYYNGAAAYNRYYINRNTNVAQIMSYWTGTAHIFTFEPN